MNESRDILSYAICFTFSDFKSTSSLPRCNTTPLNPSSMADYCTHASQKVYFDRISLCDTRDGVI